MKHWLFVLGLLIIGLNHAYAQQQEITWQKTEAKALRLAKDGNKLTMTYSANPNKIHNWVEETIFSNPLIVGVLEESFISYKHIQTAPIPKSSSYPGRFRFYRGNELIRSFYSTVSHQEFLKVINGLLDFPELYDGRLTERIKTASPERFATIMDTLYAVEGLESSLRRVKIHMNYKNDLTHESYTSYMRMLLPNVRADLVDDYLKQNGERINNDDVFKDKLMIYYMSESKEYNLEAAVKYAKRKLSKYGFYNLNEAEALGRANFILSQGQVNHYGLDEVAGAMFVVVKERNTTEYRQALWQAVNYLVLKGDYSIDFVDLQSALVELTEFSNNPFDHDMLSLIEYKLGNVDAAIASYNRSRELAYFQKLDYEPALMSLKDEIVPLSSN